MSTQTDYTDEEWQLLRMLPFAVATAVMIADASGPIAMLHESFASVYGLGEALSLYRDNTLLQALFAPEAGAPPISSPDLDDIAHTEARNQASMQYAHEVVAICARACAILTSKGTPTELEEYRRLVVHVAEKVANASREGGFLGFGGERVSGTERMLISELGAALGL